MIQCKTCSSDQVVKNGHSRHGHQRYRCKHCGVTFGELDHRCVDEERKQSALQHYAEGVGLRATERLVGVSHTAVMNWVKQETAGKALARIDASEVSFVEADELWSYVGEKKELFGSGGLLIVLPKEYSAGRWAIAIPRQPGVGRTNSSQHFNHLRQRRVPLLRRHLRQGAPPPGQGAHLHHREHEQPAALPPGPAAAQNALLLQMRGEPARLAAVCVSPLPGLRTGPSILQHHLPKTLGR